MSLIQADALRIPLADASAHMCVTSPPYWGLRAYLGDGDPLKKHELGLEQTPDEYVARMVSVFREVWRVLRDDGTLWLNLGDSYNSQGTMGPTSDRSLPQKGMGFIKRETSDLKHKDLCGIPWAVAKALQQPFYTGRIAAERDRIWLAAMIDGEGCMFIHKRKVGQNNGQGYTRKHDSFGAGLEVANTHLAIIERCQQITGQGSVTRQEKESRHGNYRNLPLYRWHMRSNECRKIIQEVYPYLTAKKHEARLLLGCPSSGEQAERAHVGLIGLHNGREADIDFPAPPSMFTQGWYLRSDVIWSKLNPMPESVTDRPTKAHEYLFLLSKSPTYFYDAEAVKERQADSTVSRLSQDVDGQEGSTRANGGQKTNGNMKAVGQRPLASETFKRNGSKRETPIPGQAYGTHRPEREDTYDTGYRNRRTVWEIPTAPYSGAHFATFPPALVEPCILAGTSARGCCAVCCAPWERVTEHTPMVIDRSSRTHDRGRTRSSGTMLEPATSTTTGWAATCAHFNKKDWQGPGDSWVASDGTPLDAHIVPCIVLDPFAGSGTTGQVARLHGRRFVGLDINGTYLRELALPRSEGSQTAASMATLPLFGGQLEA